MTPYWAHSHRILRFPASRGPKNTHVREIYKQYGSVAKFGGSSCVARSSGYTHETAYLSYIEHEHDFSSLSQYNLSDFDEDDIALATQAVKDQVAKDSLSSYDALTDIVEMRQIPGLVRDVSKQVLRLLRILRRRYGREDMRRFAEPDFTREMRDLGRGALTAWREFSQTWMSYRYGLMPLVYSYRDVMKTIARGYDVTNKKSQTVSARPTNVVLPNPSLKYALSRQEGSVTIRACSFQQFTYQELSRLSGFSFNPLQTAWEEVPYSFVIDWFVNVGDYITAHTAQTLANSRQACISRRESSVKSTYIHYPVQNLSVTHSNSFNTPWLGTSPPAAGTLPNQVLPEEEQLVYQDVTETYNRSVYDLRDVPLRWNPSLSWRRMVDTAVISNNLLRSAMRSIRNR